MEMLYIATAGASDPTRASIPVHLAVNGSIEAGQTVRLVLAGDATGARQGVGRDELEGVGLPPARDLFAKVRQHEVPVYV